jgi:DNA invertase Pin-like site-specific DNA recombinase
MIACPHPLSGERWSDWPNDAARFVVMTKGTDLCILKLGYTSTATDRLMFTVIDAIACFERELMLETQREGIAKAKA